MNVVYCCDGNREWYRDVLVDGGELYCSPRSPNDPPRTMNRPTGEYDLGAYVQSLPAPWSNPELFVLCDDTGGNSIPRNLAALRCPKVLVVGDTHHICAPGRGPIGRPIAHAMAERYDLVLGEFNRQHLHFFQEAGINAGWLPSFTLSPFEHAAPESKTHDVTFVGQTGRHPFRHHVLEQLTALGVAVGRGSAPRKETALLHAQSRINLNISLNGDLNLRHFEVLAAGGFLLTERLSPESGLSLLLEDRRQMAVFDNAVQLAELIRHYLANPAAAAEIAAAGQAEYMRFHRPAVKVQQMFDVLKDKTPDALDLRHDRRTALPAQDIESLRARVALYEFLQELHRTNLRLEVLFLPGTERQATDAIDLPRLQATVVRGNPPGAALLIAAQLDRRVTWITPAELPRRFWNIAVCPVALLSDAGLQQCLQTRRFDAIVLSDFNPQRDAAAAQAMEQRFRLKPIAGSPAAFALPAAAG